MLKSLSENLLEEDAQISPETNSNNPFYMFIILLKYSAYSNEEQLGSETRNSFENLELSFCFQMKAISERLMEHQATVAFFLFPSK